MSSTFIAIASRKSDTFIVKSTVRVCQITAEGAHVPVAYINDSADPADHRGTEIIFAGGRLGFSAAYDGPLRNQVVWPFTDENRRATGLALHYFHHSGKSYLCSADGFFFIDRDCDHGAFKITIYRSSPVSREDGMLFSPLATITQTGKSENGLEYVIQVEEKLPLTLLMAIFSLPFTLLNI